MSLKKFNFLTQLRLYCNKAVINDVNKSVQIKRKITKTDVENFAILSGDNNPVHSGEKAIVHGAFLNSIVSSVIGTKLPGPGTIVISQTLFFPNKCYINEELTVTVKIVEKRKITKIEFQCNVEEEKKVVLYGDARVMFNK